MKRSGIISILTDFGLADPYVAMMKGVILSINPDARLVDITHYIRAGSILHASSLIRETFSFFPKETVHIAVVDPGVGSSRRLIGVRAGGHLFVGPDNGIFWPIIENNSDAEIIHLTEEKYFLPHVTKTFHGREVFAPVAAYLSLGYDLKQMGLRINDPVEFSSPSPHVRDGVLYGQILRVDNFGNLITNIHSEDLKSFLNKLKPVIHIGSLKIRKIHDIYSDVEKGEPLALINSSDMLEIAVSLGRASEYVGIDRDEIIGAVVRIGRSE